MTGSPSKGTYHVAYSLLKQSPIIPNCLTFNVVATEFPILFSGGSRHRRPVLLLLLAELELAPLSIVISSGGGFELRKGFFPPNDSFSPVCICVPGWAGCLAVILWRVSIDQVDQCCNTYLAVILGVWLLRVLHHS
jgi:hypothetical protein